LLFATASPIARTTPETANAPDNHAPAAMRLLQELAQSAWEQVFPTGTGIATDVGSATGFAA
jgi:hypothetical protein